VRKQKKSQLVTLFTFVLNLASNVRSFRSLAETVPRTASKSERRGWERLPISIPFFIRGTKADNEEFIEFATALNFSASGALLAARHYLDPGTKIRLEIPVALVNKAQLPRSVSMLSATVLRCIPDRQYFLLGLEFSEPLLLHSSPNGESKTHSGRRQAPQPAK
jgi:PilZ domain